MSRPHCVIVARSGRALAASASKAGYHCHVIDAFADTDVDADTTQRCGYSAAGFDITQLQHLLSGLASRYPLAMLVVGSGLEQQHDLPLAATHLKHVCNDAGTLAQTTDPFRFSAMLERVGVPAIPVFRDMNTPSVPLLRKRIGGMGGEHVTWADASVATRTQDYYQAYIEGPVHSVVFLADGNHVSIVGYNALWSEQHCPGLPFLLGGACSTELSIALQDMIASYLQAIVAKTGLRGLCGMDFVVTDAGEVRILEINPRPPATFELHEGEQSLFAAHVQAFAQPIDPYRRCDQHRAYVIIYATDNITIHAGFDWPAWAKDRPAAGTQFGPCEPVCTVHAEATSTSELMSLIENRKKSLWSALHDTMA